MFTELKERLMKLRDKFKPKAIIVPSKTTNPVIKPAVHINLITDKVDKEKPVTIPPVKSLIKTCTYTEHDCLAFRLTNNLIEMIEMFEKDMKRIESHPSISADTKSDIQHYINKNIITTISALMPAFEIMVKYERAKDFKSIYLKAVKRGAPGIIEEKKYI